jgi:AraC-like DNA-binding protein
MIAESNTTSTRIAQYLAGKPPQREVIHNAPDVGLKWHVHDFPAEIARWNYHPEIELHFVQHSHGSYFVGDFVGEFSPGNLCLLGPFLPHHWISNLSEGEQIIDRDVVLQFDGRGICKALQFLPEIGAMKKLFSQATRGIEFVGRTRDKAIHHLTAMGRVKGIERLSLFFQLFSALSLAPKADMRLLASPWFQPNTDPATALIMNKVLNSVLAHQGQEIRMSKVARSVGMSDSSFSRFFKRAYGRGFAETVRTLHITHACRLLRETNKPISEICFDTGFGNLSNFNRRFLEEMGHTPSVYRAGSRVRRSLG